MAKTSYTAVAQRKEEIPICTALEAGNFPQRYEEVVEGKLSKIRDGETREKAKATLGSFRSGGDGYLAQSSLYMLVALQEILPESRRLSTRPRLEAAKDNDPNFMDGFYVDFGLNFVPGGYKVNPVQARALIPDLTKVGMVFGDEELVPHLIPYHILDLASSKKSPSGLVFKLSEEGKDIAKDAILNTGDFYWDHSPSVPGLFRACLDGDGYWYAGSQCLGGSSKSRRVVVETTGEAGACELEALNKQTRELFARQKKEREDLAARLSA